MRASSYNALVLFAGVSTLTISFLPHFIGAEAAPLEDDLYIRDANANAENFEEDLWTRDPDAEPDAYAETDPEESGDVASIWNKLFGTKEDELKKDLGLGGPEEGGQNERQG